MNDLLYETRLMLYAQQEKLRTREKARDNYKSLYMQEWAACDRIRAAVNSLEKQVAELEEAETVTL